MLKRFQCLFTRSDPGWSSELNTQLQPSTELWEPPSELKMDQGAIIGSSGRRCYDAFADPQVDQHVQKGIEYHESGELEKATHHFRLAAKQGSPIGMFLYGISLRHGWGCRLNGALAFQYLQKAAEHAVEDLLHSDYALASKGELIMAIYELGVSFQQGWGVAKNKETAFYYFKIAAELGDADAQNDTAHCFYHAQGTKKDMFQAAKYYRLAAAQGRGLLGNSWIFKSKYDPQVGSSSSSSTL